MSWPIGLATGGSREIPILDVLRDAARAGFDGVEIGTTPRHFDPWSQAEACDVHRELQQSGLPAVSIHAPFGGILDLSDPNPHHRNAAVGGIVQAATVLQQLGGRVIVVHPTDVPRSAGQVNGRLDACAQSLRVLDGVIQRMGLQLAVESPLPHLIGGQPDEFDWILERLDHAPCVCLDVSHVWLGGNWDEFVRIAGGRTVHVHASDNRGSFDDHLPPGEGVIDWGHVAESLRSARYAGWIILEIALPAEHRDETLARARAVAARWFG